MTLVKLAVGQEFVTVDSTGKIITDQSQAPEGTKVTAGRVDLEERLKKKLRKETAAAKLAMQKAEREGEIMDVREAESRYCLWYAFV